MNNEEINDWSEKLRTKVMFFGFISGLVYGAIIMLFGYVEDLNGFGVFMSGMAAGILALVAYHSILVRQLVIPAAIIGAIYTYFNYQQDPDLHTYFYVCGLSGFAMLTVGLAEARATTGNYLDFWRSFLFHPLGWTKHMGINTLLK
jgi:hypothetical protein